MSQPTQVPEYTVLLRGKSGARVRFGQNIEFNDYPDGRGGVVQALMSTRWEDIGLEAPLPRELWIAVRSRAESIDDAVRISLDVASSIAVLVSFCTNVVVEPPALHVAFNSSPGLTRREFMEVFLRDEDGLGAMGRWVDHESLFAFGIKAAESPHAARLFRALAQYQVALRYWNTGSQILALAHLYITCEVLTKAVQRLHEHRLGLTAMQHAALLGVDVTQGNWKHIAEAFTRREYIFEGDKDIYDAARKASDDFEHGKADLANVRQVALTVTRELFDLVRSAILSLVPSLSISITEFLMSRQPIDISPLYRQFTGFIVSDTPSDPLNLGVEGELFPTLRWHSRIKAARFEDDKLVIEPEETMTVQFAANLRLEARDYAVYVGMNPGREDSGEPRPDGWDGWGDRLAEMPHLEVIDESSNSIPTGGA